MKIANKTLMKEIMDWVITIGVAVIIGLCIRHFVFTISKVPTSSMVPTIQVGDKIVVCKFSYWFNKPQRKDLIVFHSPEEEDKLLVKRVIGVGGDTIAIKDGHLFINGKLQLEGYIKEEMRGNFEEYTIPENCYFVMGDNRNRSRDARKWKQKYVTEDLIIGKAVYKFGKLK